MPRKDPGFTIHVATRTAKRLLALKRHPRETYDDVISRLADHEEQVHATGDD